MTRSWVSIVSAACVVTSLLSPAQRSDAAPPAQGAAVTPPSLELLAQSFGVPPDGSFALTYRLSGDGLEALELAAPPVETIVDPDAPPDATPPDATLPDATLPDATPPQPAPPPIQLTVEVTNYAPIETSAELAEVVGSEVDPDAFDDVVDGVAISNVRDLLSLDDDGGATITLTIGTDVVASVEERLKMEAPGIYPLRVQLLVGDPDDDAVVATAGTVVQRLPGPADPAPAPPIDFAALAVTPSPRPGAGPEELAEADAAFERAVTLADSLDAPVTIEVAPNLVVEATRDPTEQQRIADALAGDELVALPLAPLDVSSAVAVGREDAFARLLIAGEDALTAALPTVPSRRDVWITGEPLSAGGAQELRDLGVRFLVMPIDIYRDTIEAELPRTDLFVDAALPDGGTIPLLVVDPIAAQLTEAGADEILAETTATEWAVVTLATFLVEQAVDDGRTSVASPERSVVLGTPDLAAPDGRLLAALFDLVATTSAARFRAASELIGVTDTQLDDGEPLTVELPDSAGPSLAARLDGIESTGLALASAASMLPDGDPRPAEWSNRLDALISTGYTDAEVDAATLDLRAEAAAIREAVVLPEPFTFTLTGRQGPIELRIGNDGDQPLEVLVQLSSTKLEFPDGEQVVTLRPNDETSIVVPVVARSGGTSAIDLVVATPAGEPLGEPVTLTSTVTGFSGLGQVLTGGFVLVLLTWWFTNWRARRRANLDDGRDRHPSAHQ